MMKCTEMLDLQSWWKSTPQRGDTFHSCYFDKSILQHMFTCTSMVRILHFNSRQGHRVKPAVHIHDFGQLPTGPRTSSQLTSERPCLYYMYILQILVNCSRAAWLPIPFSNRLRFDRLQLAAKLVKTGNVYGGL